MSVPSIPQLARRPDDDTFEAAIFPPQKWFATEMCNIPIKIRITNDMEVPFFINNKTGISLNSLAKL